MRVRSSLRAVGNVGVGRNCFGEKLERDEGRWTKCGTGSNGAAAAK
ncbi:MAG: hypothetical protein LBL36_00215 [Clostridiales Family XIII bacterium]|nr:hypothetical protein [Clostridiales Family XIII bacterium]